MKIITLENKVYTPSKIVCVGKNYPDHIAEMGGEGVPNEPTIFIKPNSAIAFGVNEITIPLVFGLVHHEVELSFVVGGDSEIVGYAVGLDLTLRDMQSVAKKKGLPWALAKGFDLSAPLGEFIPADSIADPCALDISLKINGDLRQHSNTKEMIFSPQNILSYVSRYMTIEEGDVFMCGTPSGVGELNAGDEVVAEISGLPSLKITMVRKE